MNTAMTTIQACEQCQEALPSQTIEPFIEKSQIDTPMLQVGVDLFDIAGEY